jgi:hypothetical protein
MRRTIGTRSSAAWRKISLDGLLDVGGREALAGLAQPDASGLDGREAEQREGVDDREQVVDLEAHDRREVAQVGVVLVARGEHELGQAGDAVDARVGQHRLLDAPVASRGRA